MNKIKIVRKDRVVYMYELIKGSWKLVKVTCMLVMMLGIFGCGSLAFAGQINDHKAVLTIIGEQSEFEGKLFVASTIRNRGTLQGAYGIHNPRVVKHQYSKKEYNEAVKAWKMSKTHDYSGGCTNWFSKADLKQAKVQRIIKMDKLVAVKTIGSKRFNNTFFKKG